MSRCGPAADLVGPDVALGEEVGEVDLEDAELVGPGVAEDPEVVAAFLLVVPAGGAERFESVDLGLDVVGTTSTGSTPGSVSACAPSTIASGAPKCRPPAVAPHAC